MRSNVIAALASLALVTPALAQQGTVYDEQSGSWTTDAPPPPSYDADATGSPGPGNVDVSVDLATPGASVTFDNFRDGLAPYGDWVTVGSYGRVWRPRVAAGWRPYYYGRWEWTDEGWLWVSDEPFGWAAYHYGRWAYDSYNGWVWIPGYQWAPAWVTWRYSPEYIGWAPLGPGFSVYVTNYPVQYGWWTFVPCRRFVGVPIHSVAFTGSNIRGIWGATHPAPPRATMFGARAPAWGGPARPFIEQRVGRAITPVRVQPVASPSLVGVGAARQPGVVHVYRPEARLPVARPAAPSGTVGAPPAPAAGFVQRPGVTSSPNTVRSPPSVGQPQPAAPGAFRPAPQAVRPQQQWQGTTPSAAAAPRGFQGQVAPAPAPSAPAPHMPGPGVRTPQQYAPLPQRAPAPAPQQYAPQRAPAPAPQQYAPQRAPAPAPQHAPAPAPQRAPAPAARPQGSYAPPAPARQAAASPPARQFSAAAPSPSRQLAAAAPRPPPSGGHPAASVAVHQGGGRSAARVFHR